jgi:hypothetical protein
MFLADLFRTSSENATVRRYSKDESVIGLRQLGWRRSAMSVRQISRSIVCESGPQLFFSENKMGSQVRVKSPQPPRGSMRRDFHYSS